MNPFEIDKAAAETAEGDVFEVLINNEILGFHDESSPDTTIFSEFFTVDVPEGYEITVYAWDSLSGVDYFNVEYPMLPNPKGATKKYGDMNYNSYVKTHEDPYDDAVYATTRYKIIVRKTVE